MKEFEDPNTPHDHDMIQIVPNAYLTFYRDDGTESILEITNNTEFPVSYKVQTTSPEKFRVRPRCGYLKAHETINIGILLKPDHELSQANKDKFLIMSTPVPQNFDMDTQQPAELWYDKNANTPSVEQHRLICVLKENGQDQQHPLGCPTGAGINTDNNRLGNYDDYNVQSKLERQLRKTQILQYITLICIGFLFAFLWMTCPNSPSISSAYQKFRCPKSEL